MKEITRILHLEDNATDAELVKMQLKYDGFNADIIRVENKNEYCIALDKANFDIILSDYTLPSLNGKEALLIALEKAPAIPFIFFSGTMGEEIAVECMHIGATDYLTKDNLTRVSTSIKRALLEAEESLKRKEAEAALFASEAKFRELFDNMSSGVAVYQAIDNGNDFIIIDFNKAAQINSYTNLDDVRGQRVTKIFPGVIEIGFLEILKRVWQSGEPEILPGVLYKDDRFSQFIESYVYKLPSGEVVAVLDDITSRKNAETKMRKSEERYRSLFENMLDGFALHEMLFDENNKSLDYRFLKVNFSFERITGLKAEDIIGKRVLEVLPKLEDYWITTYGNVVKTGKPTRFINYSRELDKYFEVVAFKQSTSKFATIFTDITERIISVKALRESEEKFRNLVTNSPNGIYLTNKEGKYMFVNPTWCSIAGLNEKEAAQDGWLKCIHPKDIAKVEKKWKQMIQTESDWEYEYRILNTNGITTLISGVATKLLDSDGNLAGYLGTNVNITKQKQIEESLKISQNELRSLAGHLQTIREEERASIAREIHDELGQVLTSLKMNLSIIGKEIAQQQKVDPNYITTEFDSMTQIIDTSIVRVRKLITELRPELLDKLGIIAAMEWQIEDFKKSTNIECVFNSNVSEIDIEPNKAIVIFRVLQEALTNIKRHAQATKAKINFDLSQEIITLIISDNGKGFSAKETAQNKSFGIIGMRERASLINGNFEINSVKNTGTFIKLTVAVK